MIKAEKKKAGREENERVCACRRRVEGVGIIEYLVLREEGASRTSFVEPGSHFYTLIIRGENGECCLRDVSRSRSAAVEFCLRFAREEVLPVNAEEVLEELLYT